MRHLWRDEALEELDPGAGSADPAEERDVRGNQVAAKLASEDDEDGVVRGDLLLEAEADRLRHQLRLLAELDRELPELPEECPPPAGTTWR
jgi:hypothetical protein